MTLPLRFFRKKPPSWLNDYPPYQQPYAAAACKLTDSQADANFAYLQANKASRMNLLAELLTGFDIDVSAGMDSQSPDVLVSQLSQWSGEYWPEYFDKNVHTDSHWIASNKQGDNLIYSVITDTAIVIGELIIRHRPSYAWSLDRAADNKRMASYNRCVLTAPWLPEPDKLTVVDIEAVISQRFLDADSFGQQYEKPWLKLLNDCISGGGEGAHLEY